VRGERGLGWDRRERKGEGEKRVGLSLVVGVEEWVRGRRGVRGENGGGILWTNFRKGTDGGDRLSRVLG
jgi:hypothetical protein